MKPQTQTSPFQIGKASKLPAGKKAGKAVQHGATTVASAVAVAAGATYGIISGFFKGLVS